MKQKISRKYIIRAVLASAIICVVIIAAIALRPQPDPFDGAAVIDPAFTPLTYSVQTFLWWDEGQAGMQLDIIQRVLNFTYIKQTFAWRDLEPEQGNWDFTQSDRIVDEVETRGLNLIVRLGQTPEWAASGEYVDSLESHDTPPSDLEAWANYCGTIAERYPGRIAAYQIWNEPNLAREWGERAPDAEAYVRLLAACSEAIRAVDSEAILISAGLSPTGVHKEIAHRDDIYLDALYRAGFQQYIDVIGIHAPGWGLDPGYGPDDAEQNGRGRWATFRRVEDLRKIMLMHDDAARQVAILEFGYTTDTVNPDYAWFAVSEEEQARYTIEAYQYAAEHWRPWVGLMNLIYMPNPRWTEADEEWWWSIGTPDGMMRPVYFSLARMDRYCGDEVLDGWHEGVSEEEYLEQRATCP
jgi:hypothetical protein